MFLWKILFLKFIFTHNIIYRYCFSLPIGLFFHQSACSNNLIKEWNSMNTPHSHCVPAPALQTHSNPIYKRCEQRVCASRHTWLLCCCQWRRTVECRLRSHSNPTTSRRLSRRPLAVAQMECVCWVSRVREATLRNIIRGWIVGSSGTFMCAKHEKWMESVQWWWRLSNGSLLQRPS